MVTSKILKGWKMVASFAGKNVKDNKESVTGVVRMVCAVEKIGKEMNVMVLLGDHVIIDACLNQVQQQQQQ